jgi:O-antigen ligase
MTPCDPSRFGLSSVLSDLWGFFAERPVLRRIPYMFFLAGPFILLIERTPADAWLSLCGLAFLVRSAKMRDWTWAKHVWVRSLLGFWLVCLASALLSDIPAYSFGEALAWARFPLFVMASAFWLAKDRRVFAAMVLMSIIGLMVMLGILTAEILSSETLPSRLSWPYDDVVSGAYLAKFGLFPFLVLLGVFFSSRGNVGLLAGMVAFAIVVMTLMTGERVSFVLLIGAGCLFTALTAKNFFKTAALLAAVGCILVAAFAFLPNLKHRYTVNFSNLIIDQDSGYHMVWRSGVEVFKTSPVIGIGPDSYRKLCPTIVGDNAAVRCHTHPHNFVIQILAETGVVGLCFYLLFVGSMITVCWRAGRKQKSDFLAVAGVVVPIAFFFPLQSNNDFFGQWINIFMWTSIAMAMASCQPGRTQYDSCPSSASGTVKIKL